MASSTAQASCVENSGSDGDVTIERLQKLDNLLEKAGLYSEFLTASMRNVTTHNNKRVKSDSYATKVENGTKNKRKRSKKNAHKDADEKLKQVTDISVQETQSVHTQSRILTGGTLRPYQLDGIQWLCNLYENGLNGILADEMGLGKTIQVIGLIAHLKEQAVRGPFLVVAPLSTVYNWKNEFDRWAPSIPCLVYHGPRDIRRQICRKELKNIDQNSIEFPVIITSYEIILQDHSEFKRLKLYWKYIVVDEGHRLKNMNCRLVKELKKLSSENRLLLTGTPLQNNLVELWSLLNFILPDVFDDLEIFESWFSLQGPPRTLEIANEETKTQTENSSNLSGEKKAEIVSKLHEILRPFLLRRLKVDVVEEMPLKVEVCVYCPMSSLQKDYYTKIWNRTLHLYLEEKYGPKYRESVVGRKNNTLRNRVMQLRKCCNHPYLFDEDPNLPEQPYKPSSIRKKSKQNCWQSDAIHFDPLIQASGKLIVLDQMLQLLKRWGHKVLIFSQMTRVLDILEDFLMLRSYQYCRLDGSTDLASRQSQVDAFNRSLQKADVASESSSQDDIFCFLLSTRAGGLGINLIAADTVIFYDSDWNPQQDNQAQDRCHRIGQTKNIVVYRLITESNFETRMVQRTMEKRKLERVVIHRGRFTAGGMDASENGTPANGWKELTDQELERLLQEDVIIRSKGKGADGIPIEEVEALCDRERVISSFTSSEHSDKLGERLLPKKGSGYEYIEAYSE